ncbi:hypothetical protein pb186bvf_003940 [Paramecium bursaria]
MDQQLVKEDMLLTEEVNIVYENENWLDRLVPLNEKKILIYFEGGDWILYDIGKRQEEKKCKIANNVKVFFQVWEGTLFYVCPDTLIVKLIDFNTGANNEAYDFPASSKHNSESEYYMRETIAEKLLVGLTQFQGQRFLVTIEQQIRCTNELPAIVYVRNIKEKYDNDPSGLEQVLFKFEYPNATAQIDMFIYNTDPQTLVLFGQDFENGQMEFAFIKPHLGDKALKIIKIESEYSQTLMNITNWICDDQIAIWLNNNDENYIPMIWIIDERLHFDKENNCYTEREVCCRMDEVNVQFQDDPPQTLIDTILFPSGCQYSVIQRLVGVEPYISLIDWKNHRLVHEFQLGDWNYVIPQNRDYIIHYDDNQDEKQGNVNIKLTRMDPKPRYCIDPRFHVLKIMEQSNLIGSYGIDNHEFQYYYKIEKKQFCYLLFNDLIQGIVSLKQSHSKFNLTFNNKNLQKIQFINQRYQNKSRKHMKGLYKILFSIMVLAKLFIFIISFNRSFQEQAFLKRQSILLQT